MTSSLGFALLGLLARSPSTGYDLSRRMRRPVGYFWSARHSQIYPELARLERAGLVRHRSTEGAGPRTTKEYATTAAGRRELAAWVASPPPPTDGRDPAMLRVYSLWLVENGAALALLSSLRDGYQDRLRRYREEEAAFDRDPVSRDDPSSPAFAAYATLRMGIGQEEQRIAWCDWLETRLRAQPSRTGSSSSP